jgi:hypothetical protein
MITTGTSHFLSLNSAIRYYRDYEPAKTRPEIARSVGHKIEEGLIHIGKPTLKAGETLTVIDNGTRYAIRSAK